MSLTKPWWSLLSVWLALWFWTLISLAYEMCFAIVCAGFPPGERSCYSPSLCSEDGNKPEAPKVFHPRSFRQTRQKCNYTIAQLYKSSRSLAEKSFSFNKSKSPDNLFQRITSRLQNQHGYPLSDLSCRFSCISQQHCILLTFFPSVSWDPTLLWFYLNISILTVFSSFTAS